MKSVLKSVFGGAQVDIAAAETHQAYVQHPVVRVWACVMTDQGELGGIISGGIYRV